MSVEGQAQSALISDAQLAALWLEHSAVLYTIDRDFARFSGLCFQPGTWDVILTDSFQKGGGTTSSQQQWKSALTNAVYRHDMESPKAVRGTKALPRVGREHTLFRPNAKLPHYHDKFWKFLQFFQLRIALRLPGGIALL